MRKKLIELFAVTSLEFEEAVTLADHLIANGVMVPGRTGDCYWATEQAYKNGYQAALDSITHCKYCAHSDNISCSKGMVWCGRMCRYMKEDGFCSIGERKNTNETN